MKKTSAGVIITDGYKFLIGHATKTPYWSIPKGLIEDDEQPINAVIREVIEETGLLLNKSNLINLGVFEYLKTKDLQLFVYYTDSLPDVSTLTCLSTFEKNGTDYPEFDKYKYIEFETLENNMYLNNSLTKLFINNNIFEKVKMII